MCGGTLLGEVADAVGDGLSPRVRGNPPDGIDSIDTLRSIPACAGEPAVARLRAGLLTVYPRVCGGTCVILAGW